MQARQRIILKVLSLLLFTIELLSPLAHHAGNVTPSASHGEGCLLTCTHTFNFFSLFLLEENSNGKESEEDESKRVFSFIDFTYLEVFNVLEKFKTIDVNWSMPEDRCNAQPSLLTLYSIFII